MTSRAWIAVAALSFGACTDDAVTDSPPPHDDCPTEIGCGPIAPPHQFVATSIISVATTPDATLALGLDLDGDGARDNQVGVAFGALLPAIDVQQMISHAVSTEELLVLTSVYSAAFPNDGEANVHFDRGLRVGDTYTGYVSGRGGTEIDGQLTAGTLTTERTLLSVPFSFGDWMFWIDLHDARVEATGIADGIHTLTIGGAITLHDIVGQVLPALRARLPEGTVVDESLFVPDMMSGTDELLSFAMQLDVTAATYDVDYSHPMP